MQAALREGDFDTGGIGGKPGTYYRLLQSRSPTELVSDGMRLEIVAKVAGRGDRQRLLGNRRPRDVAAQTFEFAPVFNLGGNAHVRGELGLLADGALEWVA